MEYKGLRFGLVFRHKKQDFYMKNKEVERISPRNNVSEEEFLNSIKGTLSLTSGIDIDHGNALLEYLNKSVLGNNDLRWCYGFIILWDTIPSEFSRPCTVCAGIGTPSIQLRRQWLLLKPVYAFDKGYTNGYQNGFTDAEKRSTTPPHPTTNLMYREP